MMIHRAPFNACAFCGYCFNPPFADGRCPECGTDYEQKMVVFQPIGLWRRMIGRVILAVVLCILLSPCIAPFAIMMMRSIFGIILALLGGLALARYLYNIFARTGDRHIVVRPAAITIHNGPAKGHVPLNDIRFLPRHDVTHWIGLKGSGRFIDLTGYFHSRPQWQTFIDVVEAARADEWARLADLLALAERTAPPRPLPNPWSRVGVWLVCVGLALLLLSGAVNPVTVPRFYSFMIWMATLSLMTGPIALLIGLWQGPRPPKPVHHNRLPERNPVFEKRSL